MKLYSNFSEFVGNLWLCIASNSHSSLMDIDIDIFINFTLNTYCIKSALQILVNNPEWSLANRAKALNAIYKLRWALGLWRLCRAIWEWGYRHRRWGLNTSELCENAEDFKPDFGCMKNKGVLESHKLSRVSRFVSAWALTTSPS